MGWGGGGGVGGGIGKLDLEPTHNPPVFLV